MMDPKTKRPNNNENFFKRMNPYNNYLRSLEVRAASVSDNAEGKMILEGKAICYDEETVLFRYNGNDYKEVIKKGAFAGANIDYCYLKYNHSDNVMAMARVKNGTLKIEERDDGVYFYAELANTTAGRDLYELVRSGIIDRMSFAFTIKEEAYDETEHRWTVYKIDTVYDFAAVTVPAYEATELYARRYEDVEALRIKEVEASEKARKERQKCKESLLLNIRKFI